MKVSVIVVAAGTGSRFGYERNKLFYPLCGEPVLTHTLRNIFAARSVHEVVIVHSRIDTKEIRRIVDDLHPIQPVRYTLGGAEREDSVYNGLLAVSPDMDVVMVHDGARPFATPDWYDQGAVMMETSRAAIYGIPLKDTIKVRGDDGRLHTLNRSRLVAAQTPQIFHRDLLMEAHKQARLKGLKATDDASLVEAMGVPVVILEGSDKNRKVTTRDDIPILSLYLKGREVQRIGTGYDVHRLIKGRPLILGGVTIPFDRGLEGHSDADVLIHAVMDALLGAAGLRDIGTYFPDTDENFKDISSLVLLSKVRHLLQEKCCRIVNLDVTLLAQQPKIKPFVPQMIENIAEALRISKSAVSVKATTTEKLGFVGREEGMVAQAAAMILSYQSYL